MNRQNKIYLILFLIVIVLTFFVAGCGSSAAKPTPEIFSSFQSPDGSFSLDVPTGWVASTATSKDGGLNQYQFTAPDKLGFLQVLVTKGSKPVTNELAKAFATKLLESYVEKTDIATIIQDETGSDGSETLTWHAKNGDSGGKMVIEMPGTTLIVVSFWNMDSAKATHGLLFDHILSTFKTK